MTRAQDLSTYEFVALDLETTGLSPQDDTIIEVAAIRFALGIIDGKLVIQKREEKSMLINPGRPITQEITMITGISNDMVRDKPQWDEVSERVRTFIGDRILVGHNVLFDQAMLGSHGIDVSAHRVIDTFELSEILSQDAESLNLGFLCKKYNIVGGDEGEHRALYDTRLAVELFLRYMSMIQELGDAERTLWDHIATRDESQTFSLIQEICHLTPGDQSLQEIYESLLMKNEDTRHLPKPIPEKSTKIYDIGVGWGVEKDLLKEIIRDHGPIHLMVPGKKVLHYLLESLNTSGISTVRAIHPSERASVSYVVSLLSETTPLSRKASILLLKIATWMLSTKTGLLDELKYYGVERDLIDLYRARPDEYSLWRHEYDTTSRQALCLIDNLSHPSGESYPERQKVIKDLLLLEEIIRRTSTHTIDFLDCSAALDELRTLSGHDEHLIHMSDMLSIIEGIYTSIPTRPTGGSPTPPGNYGETYFLTQRDLWHRGHRWLIHATDTLIQSWRSYRQDFREKHTIVSREIEQSILTLQEAIGWMDFYHHQGDPNINTTLTILDYRTIARYVPRSVQRELMSDLEESIAYGVGLSTPTMQRFLSSEYGTLPEIESRTKESQPILVYREYHAHLITPGNIILTTSQKHARDIGQELRTLHGKDTQILIQGLSGGTSKMRSLFVNNPESTILVGILDTWRDDMELWSHARHIILAKMPFDPPTDSYFLARTVGMKNNFVEYSQPMVIIRINTLISRILASGYSGQIVTSDERIHTTEWGKSIRGEVL